MSQMNADRIIDTIVDAESPLHNRTRRKSVFLELFMGEEVAFSFICIAKLCCSPRSVHHVLDQDFVFSQSWPMK